MNISASITNRYQTNEIVVKTNDSAKTISFPSKPEGYGSGINGGELLFLSLATCYCNDVYREAAKRNMKIDSVEVNVTGNFGKEGEPGTNISYDVKIQSPHPEREISDLIDYVDRIAEVHNTLRGSAAVTLRKYQKS